MAGNLFVKARETIIVDDAPTHPVIRAARREVRLESPRDLVTNRLIRSNEVLDELVAAAKSATQRALVNPRTFSPFTPVRGTSRPDLRRWGDFVASSPHANPSEQRAFWRMIRAAEPRGLARLTATLAFKDLGLIHRIPWWLFEFGDITVEGGGTLAFKGKSKTVFAGEVLIKKGGRIVSSGGSVHINAFSIKGEQ